MIGGFRSILEVSLFRLFHGPLIADVQIFKSSVTAEKHATVGGDLDGRFHMLLKVAVTTFISSLF